MTAMNHAETLTAYLSALIDELQVQGITDVVLSPGSRSTPLALLLAERPEINIYTDIDERSAGFLALGMAMAEKKPVVLLCTSGTATANYYPAVIEAFYARVPLIVLTADRPHELQDTGAPQTVNQAGMYGSHVKRFDELEIPEQDLGLIRHTRTICARMIAAASARPCGPVHMNIPLREPLLPVMGKRDASHLKQSVVQIQTGRPVIDDRELEEIAAMIAKTQKGIIICGALETDEAVKGLTVLSARLGFPVLADPLSQLRRNVCGTQNVIECYDTFLRDKRAADFLRPDLIIRFGAVPVSKGLKIWLKEQEAAYWIVDGGQGWREPEGTAVRMIYCEEAWFCDKLLQLIPTKKDQTWMASWREINTATKDVLMATRNSASVFGEEDVFIALNHLLPAGSSLFAGNSMPIRELDTYLFSGGSELTVYANRGANGIDGVVSTAVGVGLIKKHTVLVIGDLSFFHDMNGLLAARQHHANLTIILINNDGGGIFSFLPQASERTYFEPLFGTPHGLNFSHAARLYDAAYAKVQNVIEFKQTCLDFFTRPGLKIIEVPAKRGDNVRNRQRILGQMSERFSSLSGGAKK